MAATQVSPEEKSKESPEPAGYWKRFLRRYSPHGEFPISSAAAWAIHIFIILLLALSAKAFIQRDPKPPTCDVIRIGDDPKAAPDEGDGTAPGDGLEQMAQPENVPLPQDNPQKEEVKKVEVFKPVEKVTQTEEKQKQDLQQQADQAKKAAQQAAASMQDAKDQLNKNLSQSGGNKGTGGGGGTAATGRAARPARWILRFNNQSVPDYMAQLEGLGAQVAFPDRGDKYRYFSKLTSGSPQSQVKDLTSEGRLYWVDENSQSVNGVARALGLSGAPYMLAFLPQTLEDRMLKLELAHKNLDEDDILSTQFEVVRRGGSLDVIVVNQIPKR